jgi:hypothetical protein
MVGSVWNKLHGADAERARIFMRISGSAEIFSDHYPDAKIGRRFPVANPPRVARLSAPP